MDSVLQYRESIIGRAGGKGKERKTMAELTEGRNLLEMEAEKQETREFIELFRAMPKDKRRDVKYIMVGVNLMNQNREENRLV